MDVRVANFRKGPWGTALAFFDVVFDETIIARGFVLRQSKKDDKFYWQPPSKVRLEKGSNKPAKDDKGYDIYDPIVDLWGEKKDGKFTPTESAWEARDAIIQQAVEQYEASTGDAPSTKGRGGAKGAAKAAPAKERPAAAASKVEGGDGEYDEDDDLPF